MLQLVGRLWLLACVCGAAYPPQRWMWGVNGSLNVADQFLDSSGGKFTWFNANDTDPARRSLVVTVQINATVEVVNCDTDGWATQAQVRVRVCACVSVWGG